MFRADLDAALARSDRSKGGRPPMDAVMMFKVLVLEALYGLADEQTEFQIRDRLNTGSSAWADTAYRTAKNERRIARDGRVSKVHFRKPPGKRMPEPKQRAKVRIAGRLTTNICQRQV